MRVDNPLDLMNLRCLIIAAGLIGSTTALAQDHSSVAPAGELINAVIANELRDRVQQRKWMYTIEKREGNQSLTEEQVETKNGPLYRVVALDGIPLTPDQRQQDNVRIRRLLRETARLAEHATLTGSLPNGARSAIKQYNSVLDYLQKNGIVPSGFFAPLEEGIAFDEVGVASAQLAGFLADDDEGREGRELSLIHI